MIKLSIVGIDEWGRIVFKGDNERFYKTTELAPEQGFMSLVKEEQLEILRSLCSTDSFDGEPDFPCWKEGLFEWNQSVGNQRGREWAERALKEFQKEELSETERVKKACAALEAAKKELSEAKESLKGIRGCIAEMTWQLDYYKENGRLP